MDVQAIILAAPERRRILRELLNQAEPWTADQRRVYRDMIRHEWRHAMSWTQIEAEAIDVATARSKQLTFERLVKRGVPVLDAMRHADQVTYKPSTRGEQERERRRTRHESVTAMHGAKAVTTGLITECIVCGAGIATRRPGSWRRWRRDSAYCSDACRQAAYRRRKQHRDSGAVTEL